MPKNNFKNFCYKIITSQNPDIIITLCELKNYEMKWPKNMWLVYTDL